MPVVKRSIAIIGEREAIFTLSQDYGRRLGWDPFLKEATLVNAERAGVGVRAWCVSKWGLGMETEYVSFKPPEAAAVKMTRGPWMLESFAGSWRFERAGGGRTKVILRYRFETRPVWLRFILGPAAGWVFARETVRRLRALKKAAEATRPEDGPDPARQPTAAAAHTSARDNGSRPGGG